jgi:hypothetical protein
MVQKINLVKENQKQKIKKVKEKAIQKIHTTNVIKKQRQLPPN